jgi:hypothetical protein
MMRATLVLSAHNLLHQFHAGVPMNWSAGLAWLAGLARRPRKPSAEDDRAGMGTAFGLDASMMPADSGIDYIASSQPPKPWEHRLTRRTRL